MQDLECLFTTLGMYCIKEFLMRALCLLKNYWQSTTEHWWIEDTKVPRVFVCSDSAAALMALKGREAGQKFVQKSYWKCCLPWL